MGSTKTLLGHAYRVLCLDWAAAAPDDVAAANLRARIERLTSLGVDVALVAQRGSMRSIPCSARAPTSKAGSFCCSPTAPRRMSRVRPAPG